jgi:hypothetical protein
MSSLLLGQVDKALTSVVNDLLVIFIAISDPIELIGSGGRV